LDEFVKDIVKELEVLKYQEMPLTVQFQGPSFKDSFQQNQKDTLLYLSFDFKDLVEACMEECFSLNFHPFFHVETITT
jgi:hypothetical protein